MKKIFISAFFAVVLFMTGLTASQDYKMVGYYPNWGIYRSPTFKPEDIDFSLVTHINYAFAKVSKEGEILLFDPWADIEYRTDWTQEKPFYGNFRAFSDLKKKHPHIKTLISVGGWTLSDTFSEMAENPKARANFIKNVLNFCNKYDFDGVDIDWEYPGFAEHNGRPQDKQNFTTLLQELHLAVKSQSPALLVTIAAPAGPSHYKNMELDKIHIYLDWINLMTYDLHGPWGDSDNQITNHQAGLYPAKEGNPDLTIVGAVRAYLEQGVPAEKIVLGMPLYGRVFANSSGLHTAYQGAGTGTTAEVGMRFFYDIKQNLWGTYQRFWDEKAQAPYLYNPHNKEFITFDDEESLRIKSQFIKEMGLGGAMVWELGLDLRPTWNGMHAIIDELRK